MWAKVRGYNDYSVSDEGEVRNDKKGKIVKGGKNTQGYRQVRLVNENGHKHFLVHRLVSEAFIPNEENKPQVNHKDGNKLNNHVSNLEWCTSSENCYHAWRELGENRRKKITGGGNPFSTKVIRLEDNKVYGSMADAARELGIRSTDISHVCRGDRKTAGKYHWKYSKE